MKVEAYLHSLKDLKTGQNALGKAEIIREIGDNLYLAKVGNIYCTAIFNFFVDKYYVDDLYGIMDAGRVAEILKGDEKHESGTE